MQYVNYLNHPLRTVSAKENDRLMIERALAKLGDLEWTAPELHTKERPLRKDVIAAPKAPARRCTRLQTDELLALIPIKALAELMGTTSCALARWGVYVPTHHETWLRRLMENWTTVDAVRRMTAQGLKRWPIAKALNTHPDTLDGLAAEFGITGWLALATVNDKD